MFQVFLKNNDARQLVYSTVQMAVSQGTLCIGAGIEIGYKGAEQKP
jgi:hypothetical protein